MEEVDFLKIATKEKNIHIFDELVHAYLVYKGGRPATLIEYRDLLNRCENNAKYAEKKLRYVTDFAVKLGLVIETENKEYQRYLVSTVGGMAEYLKNIEDRNILGKMLGYQCYDHENYFNNEIDRLGKTIVLMYRGRKAYITEMCELSKVSVESAKKDMEHKMALFRKILPSFTIYSEIHILPSIHTRIKNLDNIPYIMEHLPEYKGDLDNNWVYPSKIFSMFVRLVENPEEYAKVNKIFHIIWNIMSGKDETRDIKVLDRMFVQYLDARGRQDMKGMDEGRMIDRMYLGAVRTS